METIEVDMNQISMATKEVSGHLAKARELATAVKDDKTYANAANYLVTIKTFRKWVKGFFKPSKDALNEAKNKVLAMEKTLDSPAEQAEAIIAPALDSFLAAKERARRAEEDRINRELKKKADDEALARAETLVEEGRADDAELELENVPSAPVATMPRTAPAVAGLTSSVRWFAEVTDKLAIVKAVAAGEIPMDALDVNMPYFNTLAIKQKEAFKFPGVVAKSRNSFAGR